MTDNALSPDEPDLEDLEDDDEFDESYDPDADGATEPEEPSGPPNPINWNLLTGEAAEEEWLALNKWVHWLRHTYGLPAAVVPPFWHRHPELVWELSALHLHWLCAYDPDAKGSAPLVWHRDFAETRQRLRDWVAASGTRLDRDRPTRQTVWPGEAPADPVEDIIITNREEDFVEYMHADVQARLRIEDEFIISGVNLDTGEVP
ncbi:hypothetical protein [uncultured Microbacterium sp.]|uniref:hypothetical protein n=1 Tax=uncultured Microbacterium sp. TaxID=191216 RepID=UPI00260500F7|nr:hypothetical protein [uncultured Microbacterium sp.]